MGLGIVSGSPMTSRIVLGGCVGIAVLAGRCHPKGGRKSTLRVRRFNHPLNGLEDRARRSAPEHTGRQAQEKDETHGWKASVDVAGGHMAITTDC